VINIRVGAGAERSNIIVEPEPEPEFTSLSAACQNAFLSGELKLRRFVKSGRSFQLGESGVAG
jgi:hypothetical protein